MKRSVQSQQGFIVLLLTLFLLIAAAIILVYLRVLRAQQ